MLLTRSSAAHAQNCGPSAGTRSQRPSSEHVAPANPPLALRDSSRNEAHSTDALAAKKNKTLSSVRTGRKRKAELLEEGSSSVMGNPTRAASAASERVNKARKLATNTDIMRTTRSSSGLSDSPTPLTTRKASSNRRASAPSPAIRSRSVKGTQDGQQGPVTVRDEPNTYTLNEKVSELQKEIKQGQKIVKDQSKIIEDLKVERTAFKNIIVKQKHRTDNLTATNKRIIERLDTIYANLTCQICLEVLTRPHTLHPCGHVFCQGCLQNWFRTAPPQPGEEDEDREDGGIPVIQRKKTCPGCRSIVRFRPVPLYVLMNILTAFASRSHNREPGVGGPLREDPWKDIFYPKTHTSSNVDDDEGENSDEESTSDDTSDGDTDMDSGSDDENVDMYRGMRQPQWAPPLFSRTTIRNLFPRVTNDEDFQLCRRGATPGMIARYLMHLDEEEGIVARLDPYTKVCLGWNIQLSSRDMRDGRRFMSWVEENVMDRQELWKRERGPLHNTVRRVVPMTWGSEVLGR